VALAGLVSGAALAQADHRVAQPPSSNAVTATTADGLRSPSPGMGRPMGHDESELHSAWQRDSLKTVAAAAAASVLIASLGWGMQHGRRRQNDDRLEREQARRQLREHYEMTEQLVDALPLPVFLTDLEGSLLLANRAFVEWLQLDEEPGPGPDRNAHRARLQALLERGLQQVRQTGHASWPVELQRSDNGARETVLTKVAQHATQNGEVAAIIGMLIDVTEYRQATRATERARQAAEAVSVAKAEFVANVSHELRTPLQSIIGFAELGEMRAAPGDRSLILFKRIESGGRRMLHLVEDLLDLSHISSTVGSVNPEPADPARALREIVDEMTPLAGEKSMQLRLEADPSEQSTRPVMLDVPRYQQVVRNVLANALKFAPAGTRVEVHHGAAEGHAVTTVIDQGPGIPAGETETIFDPFVQSSRTKDGSGGTGLGLAICRQIMQAHGGYIVAGNHPEGGAVFRFGVPLAQAAPDAAPPQSAIRAAPERS
jgi:signal transduction histidine kinase